MSCSFPRSFLNLIASEQRTSFYIQRNSRPSDIIVLPQGNLRPSFYWQAGHNSLCDVTRVVGNQIIIAFIKQIEKNLSLHINLYFFYRRAGTYESSGELLIIKRNPP